MLSSGALLFLSYTLLMPLYPTFKPQILCKIAKELWYLLFCKFSTELSGSLSHGWSASSIRTPKHNRLYLSWRRASLLKSSMLLWHPSSICTSIRKHSMGREVYLKLCLIFSLLCSSWCLCSMCWIQPITGRNSSNAFPAFETEWSGIYARLLGK